ncbi:MAG: trehalose-6-phosphate synthase [Ilumatobacteraceae bacterium]
MELFTRLPWRNQIIEGLLGCDLIGFQRPMGASNFVTAARILVNADVEYGTPGESNDVVILDDHRCEVGDFPISIDVEEFATVAAGRAARRLYSQNRARLGEPEVVLLGVDRLDYTKGIGLRLRAYKSLARRRHTRQRTSRDGAGGDTHPSGRRALSRRASRDRAARR